MTVVVGKTGSIKLRRSNSLTWTETIQPDDVNTTLHRVGFEDATENILIGDRIRMETDDPRGLAFILPEYWNDGATQSGAAPHVHVNAMGGLRLFKNFVDAVNNNREAEVKLGEFTGEPLDVRCTIRDTIFNDLGLVESYRFNSDRASIDITGLGERFKAMYDAGLLSGSGTIDTLFATGYTQCTPDGIAPPTELPLVMMQLIQRLEVGSSFDAALHLTEKKQGAQISVFYDIHGVITRSGVDVRPNDVVKVAIDFVTTGEFRLLVGDPEGYLLKEDDFYISTERGLGFLLKEETD